MNTHEPTDITPENITHRRVLAVALPIVLSNATQPILGAVDTGVVGQLGEAAPIGAVGVGAIVIASVYWLFGFLRMGTSGLVAQARGAGDTSETGALLMRGLMIGAAGGLLVFVAQFPLFSLAFKAAPASPEVEEMARQYLGIRVWGAPAAISVFALTGWLIAMERTREVLVLQVWQNGLNIVLDLWFVLELGWGVEGVAIATIIAEWTGLALALWFARAAFGGDQWRDWARVFDRVRLKRMAAVNGDIMIRSILLNLTFILFVFWGAGFGDVTLAANQVLLQFLEITAFALDGFAFAAEALVGQALGARMAASLRKAAILSSIWGFVAVCLMAAGFWLAGPYLIDLMAKSGEVQAAAREYLPWVALSPIVGVTAWMLDGIFIGATRTRAMRVAAIEAVAVYLVVIWPLTWAFGNHGLWLALWVSFVARGITLLVRYPALEAEARTPKTTG